jgi:short-subunit dehydrogenase
LYSKTDSAGAALVTGASLGIGRELADLFVADGYDVVLVSRTGEDLERVAEELESDHGVETVVVPADLSDPASAHTVHEAVEEAGYRVDALVKNAGFGVYGESVETDLESELYVVNLHAFSVTVLAKLCVHGMVERGHGYVLNNASIAGWASLPTSAVYSAAKHFEPSFSEALAEEVADEAVTRRRSVRDRSTPGSRTAGTPRRRPTRTGTR